MCNTKTYRIDQKGTREKAMQVFLKHEFIECVIEAILFAFS